MNEKIMVSIICNTYNHERYIRQALDGFVNQKTDFKFEILIHDDASTDKTADIIREYEKNYPELIKPIYQTENQYSKGSGTVGKIQCARAQGKYIALCEGDDYWTDKNKLQTQVDALENNPSCFFCVCGTEIVKEDGSSTGKSYPKVSVNEGIISSSEFMKIIKTYNFHTSTYFVLTDLYKELYLSPPKFKTVSMVGDEPMMLYFGHAGNVYFINKKMTCYRTDSISSWSRNVRSKKENALKHIEGMRRMIEEFDKFSDYIYHDTFIERLSVINFQENLINENYKEVLKKENSQYYKKLRRNEKIKIHLKRALPFLYPVLLKCYNKLRKK